MLTDKHKMKCLCTDPQCAKCLGVNCQDKDCVIHTLEAKIAFRMKWEHSNRKANSDE